jgi:hypothetical protein
MMQDKIDEKKALIDNLDAVITNKEKERKGLDEELIRITQVIYSYKRQEIGTAVKPESKFKTALAPTANTTSPVPRRRAPIKVSDSDVTDSDSSDSGKYYTSTTFF